MKQHRNGIVITQRDVCGLRLNDILQSTYENKLQIIGIYRFHKKISILHGPQDFEAGTVVVLPRSGS